MSEPKNNIFLFSVDLEDIRLRMAEGSKYSPRVGRHVENYLEFLNKHHSKATFFTVGDIPKYYDGLIKSIASEGHEIACHSSKHIPVTEQTRDDFKRDLLSNLESLNRAGATTISGYRAPAFSITPKSVWAFEVLAECGIKYSSSILPANNPLYGWEGFGGSPRKLNEGLWEIPISIRQGEFLRVPFAGGVYFRVLPMQIIKKAFADHFKNNSAVTGYFHPYDIDVAQERFMHPGINDNMIYNWLLYFNRSKVFDRLDKIIENFDAKIITYKNFVDQLNEKK